MKKRAVAGVALLAALCVGYGASGLVNTKDEPTPAPMPSDGTYIFCRAAVPDRDGCVYTIPAHVVDPRASGNALKVNGGLASPTGDVPISTTYCKKGETVVTSSINIYQFCQSPMITL